MDKLIYNRNIMEKDGFYIKSDIRGANVTGVGVSYDANTEAGIIFIARHACEVLWIAEAHKTASSGSVSVMKRENGGSSDLTIHSSFTVSGSTYTTQTKSGGQLTKANCSLKEGDMLVVSSSGLDDDANINITVYLRPSNQGNYR